MAIQTKCPAGWQSHITFMESILTIFVSADKDTDRKKAGYVQTQMYRLVQTLIFRLVASLSLLLQY